MTDSINAEEKAALLDALPHIDSLTHDKLDAYLTDLGLPIIDGTKAQKYQAIVDFLEPAPEEPVRLDDEPIDAAETPALPAQPDWFQARLDAPANPAVLDEEPRAVLRARG